MSKTDEKATFDGQHDDEEVLMVFRRHPIVMRKGLIAILVGILLGFLPVTISPTNLALLWFIPVGLLAGAIVMFYSWMGWFYSLFIVSDQRLIQITQKGFFNQTVVDIGLDKIQNINFQVAGFQETVLGYGTLLIQTFVGDMVIEQVQKPQKVQQHLVKVIKELGFKSFMQNLEDVTQGGNEN